MTRAPMRPCRTAVMDSARWDGFEPRDDDIVIATFSKCGTTWMQRIVDLLVFQSPEPRPVSALSPWLDATIFAPVEQDLTTLAAQTHRRFIKTHLPFDSLPLFEGARYIHVVRDGRDACLSMHNHQLGFRPELRQRIVDSAVAQGRPVGDRMTTPADPRDYYQDWIARAEAYAADPGEAEPSFFAFETTYWRERRRPELLFVHYTDLKADLAGEMRRLSTFLGIDTPEALMPALAEAATFEAMKRDGAALLPQMEFAFDRGADRFLNKGINGRWREALTPDDIGRYDALAAGAWTPAQSAWIAGGRLAAGEPRDLPD